VALVRTNSSDERIVSIIRIEAILSSETSVLKRAALRNIPEQGVLLRITGFLDFVHFR
jgi:hypothetical protein